jgi:prevent-host-death family protein
LAYDYYDHISEGSLMSSWSVAEAKARFSEVIEKALREGAQEVTRHGRRTAVVVSAAEWDRQTRRKGNLVDLLNKSPLQGSGLTIERPRELPRDVEL